MLRLAVCVLSQTWKWQYPETGENIGREKGKLLTAVVGLLTTVVDDSRRLPTVICMTAIQMY